MLVVSQNKNSYNTVRLFIMVHLPVNATALQTKDISKTNTSPLRVLHSTIRTLIISGKSFYNGLIGRGHLHHGDEEVGGGAMCYRRESGGAVVGV